MLLLSARFEPSRSTPASSVATACWLAAAGGITLTTAALTVDLTQGLPNRLGWAAAGAAVHATFFALGWILATEGAPGWRRPALAVAAALLSASIAGRLSPLGALAYTLVPPLVVFLAGNRVEFGRMGVTWPHGLRSVAAGVGVGGFLGFHLLLSSSLTFGYAVRLASLAETVAAIAYSVGGSGLGRGGRRLDWPGRRPPSGSSGPAGHREDGAQLGNNRRLGVPGDTGRIRLARRPTRGRIKGPYRQAPSRAPDSAQPWRRGSARRAVGGCRRRRAGGAWRRARGAGHWERRRPDIGMRPAGLSLR